MKFPWEKLGRAEIFPFARRLDRYFYLIAGQQQQQQQCNRYARLQTHAVCASAKETFRRNKFRETHVERVSRPRELSRPRYSAMAVHRSISDTRRANEQAAAGCVTRTREREKDIYYANKGIS